MGTVDNAWARMCGDEKKLARKAARIVAEERGGPVLARWRLGRIVRLADHRHGQDAAGNLARFLGLGNATVLYDAARVARVYSKEQVIAMLDEAKRVGLVLHFEHLAVLTSIDWPGVRERLVDAMFEERLTVAELRARSNGKRRPGRDERLAPSWFVKSARKLGSGARSMGTRLVRSRQELARRMGDLHERHEADWLQSAEAALEELMAETEQTRQEVGQHLRLVERMIALDEEEAAQDSDDWGE